jgi:hypothetical protein
VLFLRDEMANMAWAVERTVLGPSGRTLDRFEALQARRRREEVAKEAASPGSTAPAAGPLEYKLASEIPDYWYPLLPVSVEGGRLRCGSAPCPRGQPPSPVR